MLKTIKSALLLSLAFSISAQAQNYNEHPKAIIFVDKMVAEHAYDRDELLAILARAEKKQSILDAISRPAERVMEWKDYSKIFSGQARIDQGRTFMLNHSDSLRRAEQEFAVPANIVSAIIGVETSYGRNKGSYRVIDSLATLAFDYPPRSKFFAKQFAEYLILTREEKLELMALKGSYAGAMGYGQFIASSYRAYAVDFDGDGVADIVNNPVDAIGSVANYFNAHRWQPGQPVMLPVRVDADFDDEGANSINKPVFTLAQLRDKGFHLQSPNDVVNDDTLATPLIFNGADGPEYWIGFTNFYVITRYNRSHLYARAVYDLSENLQAE